MGANVKLKKKKANKCEQMTNEKMTPLSTNVVCCLLIAKRSGLCVKETEQGKQNFSKSKQTNKKKKNDW